MRCAATVTVVLLLAAGASSACKTPAPEQVLTLTPEALAQRQRETRRFETSDEVALLRAALIILQDEGFQLDEMEAPLGVVAGTRPGTAVAVVTHRLVDDERRIALRVTFQQPAKYPKLGLQRVSDPATYQRFFERLSAAMSLEAQAP